MVNIPAGNVTVSQWGNSYYTDPYFQAWSTPDFSMGKYLVTFELWRLVADYADAGGYRFANTGSQGWKWSNSKPVLVPDGNKLHPVGSINWRDAVVWCNALSEMDGREPVYRDSDGNVFRDSRVFVEELINESKMTGNGYRLPTPEEWCYAARGANPNDSQWSNLPGGVYDYDLLQSVGTTEVGTLLPNSIGLFDMTGLGMTPTYFGGWDSTSYGCATRTINDCGALILYSTQPFILRLARNKE